LAAERFKVAATRSLVGDEALVEDLVARRTDPYGAAAMLVKKAVSAS
jgi:hypothetical protein